MFSACMDFLISSSSVSAKIDRQQFLVTTFDNGKFKHNSDIGCEPVTFAIFIYVGLLVFNMEDIT